MIHSHAKKELAEGGEKQGTRNKGVHGMTRVKKHFSVTWLECKLVMVIALVQGRSCVQEG